MDKKFIAIIITLVLVILFFITSLYQNKRVNETVSSITQASTTERDNTLTEDDIILKNEESGYILYYKNEIATLVNGELSLEFPYITDSLAIAEPEMYYADFDGDDEKEMLLKLASSSIDYRGESIISYVIHLFEIVENNGIKRISYITANSESWKEAYKYSINFDCKQLSDPKYLQITLNDKEEPITYDESTGITDNEYTYYAAADKAPNGDYYTLKTARFAAGIYNVSDDKITLDIAIFASYNETEEEFLIGYINCDVMIYHESFRMKPRTIHFVPLDEYVIDDPRATLTNE